MRREAGRWLADAAVCLVVAGWHLAALRLPEYVLPGPLPVLTRTVQLFVDPQLAAHTFHSLARVLLALVLGLILGTALTLLAHYARLLRETVLARLMPFLNAFPTLGWAILAVYWFKTGDGAVIFVQVAIILPFVMINVWEGLKNLDVEVMEMAHSFARHPLLVLGKVLLPLLFPYLFAAARVSYGVAWKIALVAELFGTRVGLGYLMNYARFQFDSVLLFATIAALLVMVFAVERLIFTPVERRIQARWT